MIERKKLFDEWNVYMNYEEVLNISLVVNLYIKGVTTKEDLKNISNRSIKDLHLFKKFVAANRKISYEDCIRLLIVFSRFGESNPKSKKEIKVKYQDLEVFFYRWTLGLDIEREKLQEGFNDKIEGYVLEFLERYYIVDYADDREEYLLNREED